MKNILAWIVTIWGALYFVVDFLGNLQFAMQQYEDPTWLQAVIKFVIDPPWLFRVGVFAIGCLWLTVIYLKQKPRPESAELQARTAIAPPVKAPTVKFGYPKQGAGEPFVSIWKIPITLIGDQTSDPKFYNRCTVKLIFHQRLNILPPELALRSEQRGVKGGVADFTLAVGDDPRMIPIAIRSEKDWDQLAQSEARFMDEAFFEQSPHPIRLGSGEYNFSIRISSGLQRWESEIYQLTVPLPNISNGQFLLGFA